jgi:hypothetical protein
MARVQNTNQKGKQTSNKPQAKQQVNPKSKVELAKTNPKREPTKNEIMFFRIGMIVIALTMIIGTVVILIRYFMNEEEEKGVFDDYIHLTDENFKILTAEDESGTYGQLGINSTPDRSSPVQVGALTTWSKVAAGGNHSLAIKTDGTLWSWGFNNRGQLGQNNTTYRSSPVQIGASTDWAEIAGGFEFSLAVKTNGTLWSWGQGFFGQLGLNDNNYRSSPVQIGALTTWSQIAGGKYFTLALKTDGTMWGWGRNNDGQLGQNNQVNLSSPVQVGALTTWARLPKMSTASFSLAISL